MSIPPPLYLLVSDDGGVAAASLERTDFPDDAKVRVARGVPRLTIGKLLREGTARPAYGHEHDAMRAAMPYLDRP
ncbi:hypothetical protein [Phycisphaera mikurensis]|uniref:Uncharacterized protein n=1 Tax=Phycisphaera mikurensis (strain NBRC 102666 / KCTC 22515 / FYK2301M01) TaxID=1142394 RepID=I0IJD7_PHYMF|nr:hypothetical protein [Phycisphaera mikurensis]MBB6443203.1 hypothetical protein [Phycisphaera mikurensis]BAM05375.1 hypothetical protein PSMK_p00130 [Phycisphaera mikurensis NBRC 102666]